jgi:hypothetical protein
VPSDNELLQSIDAKLSAVLTLVLDGYLRQTGVARAKSGRWTRCFLMLDSQPPPSRVCLARLTEPYIFSFRGKVHVRPPGSDRRPRHESARTTATT